MILELVLFMTALLFYFAMQDRKPKGMPPGPLEIPFVGNKPVETVEYQEDLRKTYGDIVTTRFGNTRMVIISDYNLAKEAMAHPDVADRPPIFRVFQNNPEDNNGILGSTGLPWVHDRRFALRHLKDLGMGKTQLEVAIHNEARAIVEHLKSFDGKPTKYPKGIRNAVLNVVWQLVVSKRYDLDTDEEVDDINKTVENARAEGSNLVFAEVLFPILKAVPEFLKNHLFKLHLFGNFRKEIKVVTNRLIAEHEKTFDENNPRDLVDEYLIELSKTGSDPHSLINRAALCQIVADMFIASTETMTNMLRWVIFFMAKNPDVAKRAQEEIDEVVGDEMVSILDKSKLPYVEALTAEAFRLASFFSLNIQRYSIKDIKLGGYFIPKGTSVTVNSYHIHHDDKFWKEPLSFKPERFLDSDGKFQAKYGRSFAFGSGRRVCLGESLGRMEFFLFTSAILQNFTIEKPAGTKLNETVIDTLGNRIIADQDFIYRPRKF